MKKYLNLAKNMNIAIEAFALSLDKVTGIGNVVLNYIMELQSLDRENNYYIYTTDELNHATLFNGNWHHVMYMSWPKRAKLYVRESWLALKNESSRNPGIWVSIKIFVLRLIKMFFELINRIWHPLWFAVSLRKNKIDVYWGNFADFFPLFFLSKMKKLWLIHDLVWKIYPETLQQHNLLKSYRIKRSMKRTDILLAVSDNTKKDIRKFLHIRKNIITLHNAADKTIFRKASPASIKRVKKKLGITKKYILSVCTLEPRKNLAALLAAYELIQKRDRYQLVLAGMSGWKNTSLFGTIRSHPAKENIIITGYIPSEDLAPLYSGAEIFVYPTLYEGFGLPVLEAMQCGCPVISSTASSIPEVIGTAGIMINPLDIFELKDSIDKLLSDKRLRTSLGKKGLARAKSFSWNTSARRLLEIIQNESA